MQANISRKFSTVVFLTVAILSSVDAQRCRPTCQPPDCSCPRIKYPMPTRDIPQMVYFGFDDAVNVVMASLYERIFTTKRKNPNGCRMKMSLFVSHQYTDYKKVKQFYDNGNEIGVHSVTHTAIDNDEILFKEAKDQKDNLVKAGVPAEKIVGWRSPFLKTAGNNQPQILKDLGYEYDISLTYTRSRLSTPKPWPFTMDHGWPYACGVEPCPSRAQVDNFWAVPVNSLMDHKNSYPCPFVDGCAVPALNEPQAYDFLMNNFLSYYNTTRAPFGLNMHAAWFYTRHNLLAMMRFLDDLMNFHDVYVITVSQMLDWMRHPTPMSEIDTLTSWQCAESRNRGHRQQKLPKPTPKPKQNQRRRPVNFFDLFRIPTTTRRKPNRIPMSRRPVSRRPVSRRPISRRIRPIASRVRTKAPSSTTRPTTMLRSATTTTTPRRTTTTTITTTTPRPTTTTQRRTTTTTTTTPRPTTTTPRPTTTTQRIVTTKRRQPTTSTTSTTTTPTTTTKPSTTTPSTTTPSTTTPTTTTKPSTTTPTTTTKPSTTTPTTTTTTTTKATTTKATTKSTTKATTTKATTTTSTTTIPTTTPTTTAPTTRKMTSTTTTTQSTTPTTIKPTTTRSTTTPTTTTSTTTTPTTTTLTTTKLTTPMPISTATPLTTTPIPTTSTSKTTTPTDTISRRTTTSIRKTPTARKNRRFLKIGSRKQTEPAKHNIKHQTPKHFVRNGLNRNHRLPTHHIKIGPTKSTNNPSTDTQNGLKYCVQGINCNLPSCFCQGENVPMGLKLKDTPQMIFITLDGSVNTRLYRRYGQIFAGRSNPNHCRARGTVFATGSGSTPSMIRRITDIGAEIAMSGMHEHHYDTVEHMEQELQQQKILLKHSNVDSKGWKTPELKAMGNDQFRLLSKHNFLYDATLSMSLPRNRDNKTWPFTLDFGFQGSCVIPECPSKRFKGLWEIPSIPVRDYKKMYECAYVDGCMFNPPTANHTEAFLWDNFMFNYKSNKAPFGLHLRQLWFSHYAYKPNIRGLKNFLDRVMTLEDVYLVSTSDIIEWMQNPVPLNSISTTSPWKCP